MIELINIKVGGGGKLRKEGLPRNCHYESWPENKPYSVKILSFGNLIFLPTKMNHPILHWGAHWLGHNPICQPTDTGSTEA